MAGVRTLVSLLAVIGLLAYHLARQLVIGVFVFAVFTAPILLAWLVWKAAGGR